MGKPTKSIEVFLSDYHVFQAAPPVKKIMQKFIVGLTAPRTGYAVPVIHPNVPLDARTYQENAPLESLHVNESFRPTVA